MAVFPAEGARTRTILVTGRTPATPVGKEIEPWDTMGLDILIMVGCAADFTGEMMLGMGCCGMGVMELTA